MGGGRGHGDVGGRRSSVCCWCPARGAGLHRRPAARQGRGARGRISGGAGERRAERKRRGGGDGGGGFGAMSGLNWFESTGRRGLYKA